MKQNTCQIYNVYTKLKYDSQCDFILENWGLFGDKIELRAFDYNYNHFYDGRIGIVKSGDGDQQNQIEELFELLRDNDLDDPLYLVMNDINICPEPFLILKLMEFKKSNYAHHLKLLLSFPPKTSIDFQTISGTMRI